MPQERAEAGVPIITGAEETSADMLLPDSRSIQAAENQTRGTSRGQSTQRRPTRSRNPAASTRATTSGTRRSTTTLTEDEQETERAMVAGHTDRGLFKDGFKLVSVDSKGQRDLYKATVVDWNFLKDGGTDIVKGAEIASIYELKLQNPAIVRFSPRRETYVSVAPPGFCNKNVWTNIRGEGQRHTAPPQAANQRTSRENRANRRNGVRDGTASTRQQPGPSRQSINQDRNTPASQDVPQRRSMSPRSAYGRGMPTETAAPGNRRRSVLAERPHPQASSQSPARLPSQAPTELFPAGENDSYEEEVRVAVRQLLEDVDFGS